MSELEQGLEELATAFEDMSRKESGHFKREFFRQCAERARGLKPAAAVDLWLTCPRCNLQHVDRGEFVEKRHHTHACQGCGLTWRPAIGPTRGVQFLPGFKDDPS